MPRKRKKSDLRTNERLVEMLTEEKLKIISDQEIEKKKIIKYSYFGVV